MKNSFKIIAGIDYSAVSDNAARYAIELAMATGSSVTFFHAYGKGRLGFPTKFEKLEKVDESQDEFEESKLQQHIEHLMDSSGIDPNELECSYYAAEGNTTAELLNAAKQEKADFIVLGTHANAALKETFFGGHTWEAIKKEAVPVLAIPPEASFSIIKNIVFTTEYRQNEIPLIRQIVKYAKGFGAGVTVLHIANNVFSPQFDQELFKGFKDEVQRNINYSKLTVRLVKSDSLVEGISKFCLRVKANWLVMSHEKAPFFIGLLNPVSLTKKMSLHTHIPLFALPDGYDIKETGRGKQQRLQKNVKYSDFFA